MNALIFAAGLGTRLKPLTNTKPKALIEVNGKPLLGHAIQHVMSAGIERIVVNVHHFADQVEDYILSNNWGNCEIVLSDERDNLLDTGGGLLKASPLFIPIQPILLYNADIICSADLKSFIDFHNKSAGVATLMVNRRRSSRYLLFNKHGQLIGWHNEITGEYKFSRKEDNYEQIGFCGVHIVNFNVINLLGETRKFSLTQGYLDLAKSEDIYKWELDENNYWFDIGSIEKKELAEQFFTKAER